MTENLGLTIKEKEERKFALDSQDNVALRVLDNSINNKGFNIPIYDTIELTYEDSNIKTVTYKKDTITVTVLTLTYSSGNLVSVVKS